MLIHPKNNLPLQQLMHWSYDGINNAASYMLQISGYRIGKKGKIYLKGLNTFARLGI